MSTVDDELDIIQERLHDDGAIWSRDELLLWYNDAYTAMLSNSGSCRRFYIFDVPPRVPYSVTQEWEAEFAGPVFRKFTKTIVGGTLQASFEWEVEYAELATPTNSLTCITQIWELDYIEEAVDDHYRFFLPRSHEQIKRVAWDDKKIFGTSDKELDPLATKWWQDGGEPLFYLRGLDRDASFETYKIQSAYSEAYVLPDSPFGVARLMSGDRDYTTVSLYSQNNYGYTSTADTISAAMGLGWRFTTQASDSSRAYCCFEWEAELLEGATTFTDASTVFTYWWEADYVGGDTVTFALGLARAISSPDRQYLPMAYDTGEFAMLGTIRDFKSSEDSISVLESIVNTRDLTTDDAPALVPPRLYKYLRYYVWGMAFGREGEAQRAKLAAHYMARFQEGAKFFKKLGDLTSTDRNYGRTSTGSQGRGIPAFPRLPSTYEVFR